MLRTFMPYGGVKGSMYCISKAKRGHPMLGSHMEIDLLVTDYANNGLIGANTSPCVLPSVLHLLVSGEWHRKLW
jgi:hypothetical protein